MDKKYLIEIDVEITEHIQVEADSIEDAINLISRGLYVVDRTDQNKISEPENWILKSVGSWNPTVKEPNRHDWQDFGIPILDFKNEMINSDYVKKVIDRKGWRVKK